MIAGDSRTVVAIESTPLEYWIATTDPADLALFDAEVKRAPDRPRLNLLQELALKYPKGVGAAGPVGAAI